jgi:ketosteroid isomerase-like protein
MRRRAAGFVKRLLHNIFLIKKTEEIDEKNRTLRKWCANRLPSLQIGGFGSDEFLRGIEKRPMRRVWPCILVLVFLPGAICSRSANDESKIIALENLWNQMQLHHDAGAMEKILDADFVLTDYDGAVLSKSQFLASILDVSDQLTVEVSEDMKLHRHGDTVVVTGATHEKGTNKGKHYEHRGRFTDTWILKNGEWLCVASHLGLLSK